MIVQTHTRPVTSLRLLCDIASNHGVDALDCLDGTGIDPKDLDDPEALHSTDQEIQAIENLVKLAPRNVGLGWAVGQATHVHAFGVWGFAILTSPTLRSAIETAIEYSKLSYLIADLALRSQEDRAIMTFDLNGLPKATHRYIIERHTGITITFIRTIIQQPNYNEFLIQMMDEPTDYVDEMTELTGVSFETGHSFAGLSFPVELLDAPLPKSDPVSLKFCLDQCKALLEERDGILPPWSQQVRDAIVDKIGTEQKIEDVAETLLVTERTLRRRLTDEGTSFRDLYIDARMAIAWELLASAGLNVETVAWRVGYSEPASFARTFSKKYGMTPGEVRKRRALKTA